MVRVLGLVLQVAALLTLSSQAGAQTSLSVNRILYVAATGTAQANCLALKDAIAGISGNGTFNRYLIQLEPGIYDCASQTVVFKPYVSVQGAGSSTVILGLDDTGGLGFLWLASNMELRSVAVVNYAASGTVAAISGSSVSDARLFDVHVTFTDDGTTGTALVATTNSDITVSYSTLEGTENALFVNTSAKVTADYSVLIGGVTGAGTKLCRLCSSASGARDFGCAVVP